MLSNQDKAEIMKMLADIKKELRKEIWEASNKNYDDKKAIKSSVADVENALCEIDEKGE